MILVTGGAGFIGSNFVLDWITTENTPVVNLDKLTYAGNLNNLSSLGKNSKHIFVQGDIGDRELLRNLLKQNKPGRSCTIGGVQEVGGDALCSRVMGN